MDGYTLIFKRFESYICGITMNYRELGTTGIEVSEIGLGLWSVVTDWWGNPYKGEDLLRESFSKGITFYDTGDIYGEGRAEEIIAKALGNKRDQIVILTKIGYDFYNKVNGRAVHNFSVDFLEFAFSQSLKRLNTDYVDVLMIHNPKMDVIRRKDVFDFLLSLKNDGKVRAIGVALGPTLGWGEEGKEAIRMGYEALEHIYNLIEQYPGRELLNYRIGHVTRVPHASDALLERRWPITDDKSLHRSLKKIEWIKAAVERSQSLLKFAREKGMTLSQLALKFVLYNRNVSTVVPNITNLDELNEFLKVEKLPDLKEDDMNFIEEYYEKYYKDLNEESIEETKIYK
jgi:aryl-alcohol dehydrogenase-like predicted oxidoreductase